MSPDDLARYEKARGEFDRLWLLREVTAAQIAKLSADSVYSGLAASIRESQEKCRDLNRRIADLQRKIRGESA